MYVYIMSSRSRTLYIGVTNDLQRRVYEHVTNSSGFTGQYRIHRLVYFEEYQRPIDAIEREKRIKALLRKRKIALIEEKNPAWDDLSEGWFELPVEKA
jgi:putative endonuclease